MLTDAQVREARRLLINRPDVIPGTRVIPCELERRAFYRQVSDAIFRLGIENANDRNQFCDYAGVPD